MNKISNKSCVIFCHWLSSLMKSFWSRQRYINNILHILKIDTYYLVENQVDEMHFAKGNYWFIFPKTEQVGRKKGLYLNIGYP